MLEEVRNSEYKDIVIEGLDTTKHYESLENLYSRGWVLFRSTPDIKSMNFKYKLKRNSKLEV